MSDQNSSNTSNQQSLVQTLRQMMIGYQLTQLIYVAAKLNIADLLLEGPKSSNDLAVATGTHPHALLRLLRSLTSHGIFTQDDDDRFKMNPMGELLRDDVPNSLRPSVILNGECFYRAWGDLLYSVKTGRSSFERSYNKGFFEYLEQDPEIGELFNRAMTMRVGREVDSVLSAYDFSDIGTLVDVGGGHGNLIASVLKAYPHMRGVLFDLPNVIAGAKTLIDENGLSSRCSLVGGSFFESVPEGGDAYMLSGIIHDWNDERATTILRNCHLAISSGSKLLLIEPMTPNKDFEASQTRNDLLMLVSVEGANRTEDEYLQLLNWVGFKLRRIIRTESWMGVIEAVPA